jgi:hypothetical protein
MAKDLWRFGGGDIFLELDFREMGVYLDGEVEKQFAFAGALALTWTAKDVRDDLRARLPLYFTVRNKWNERQIQMRGAKKTQPIPFAEVGSTQEYMEWHATGAWKERKGKDRVTVPVRIRRPKTVRTTRSRWAGAVGRRGRTILLDMAKGATGLFTRKGRGDNEKLVFQYLFVDKARIQKVWPFRQLVERRVAHSYEKLAMKALGKALATAKKNVRRRT